MEISNETVLAARSGDQSAARLVVQGMEAQSIKLVNKICGHYHRDDGMAEALMAVWEAVRTFDPENTATFSTYAHSKIRLALLAFVSTNTPGPTVPERSVKRYNSHMDAANGDPIAALRALDASTSARTQTGSPAAFTAAHMALTDPKHIGTMIADSGDGEPMQTDIRDTNTDVAETATDNVIVSQMLDGCTDRERAILERTYGINGQPEQKDADIAAALGISRPRVVTIRKAATSRLAETNNNN